MPCLTVMWGRHWGLVSIVSWYIPTWAIFSRKQWLGSKDNQRGKEGGRKGGGEGEDEGVGETEGERATIEPIKHFMT